MRWLFISPLGTLIGVVAGRLLRIRRREVLDRMLAAGVADGGARADEMYRSLGVGLVELVLAGVGVPLSVCAPFDESGLEALRARHPRTGVVVASAHTANWDLVACHVAQRWPLLVITKHLHVPWLDRFWQHLRARRGISIVGVGGAASAALGHLRRGGAVVAMLDQAPESRRGATQGSFFYQAAGLDLSPALLAMRARVPLIVAFPRRLRGGSYTVDLRLEIEPPKRPSAAWAAKALQAATDCLESFVRESPGQWMWLHRRWKAWPPSSPGRRRGTATSGDQGD